MLCLSSWWITFVNLQHSGNSVKLQTKKSKQGRKSRFYELPSRFGHSCCGKWWVWSASLCKCVYVRNQDDAHVRVCVSVWVMAFHSGQRWRVSKRQGPDVTRRDEGGGFRLGGPWWGEKETWQGGEETDDEGKVRGGGGGGPCVYVCGRTRPVRWPKALAGPGGQECAVVCGWDPPLSAPACPPSPHTSGLFIMRCGKITAPAVSSGFWKVYAPHPHSHTHITHTTTTWFPTLSVTNNFRTNYSTWPNWHINTARRHYHSRGLSITPQPGWHWIQLC